MEWYYDYATGQLHNGVGWNYNLTADKLENTGQAMETLDHITKLGDSTHEMDDGSNAAFVSQPGKDNQFNKGNDAQVKKNIYYDSETRQLTTFYNGIHYHLSLPIDPHHEGPKLELSSNGFHSELQYHLITSPITMVNPLNSESNTAPTTVLSEEANYPQIDEKIKKLWQINNQYSISYLSCEMIKL